MSALARRRALRLIGWAVAIVIAILLVPYVVAPFYRDHFGTQFVEYMRRNVIGRAVGTIHHQLEAAQIQIVGKSTFAKLDVTSRRIVQAPRLA